MPPETASPTALELRFPAMGGHVHAVSLDEDEAGLEKVRQIFEACEQTLSRFRPASELCALNCRAGTPTRVSPLLFDALEAAMRWSARTDGVFDATLLDALEAAGYDRTFEDVPPSGDAVSSDVRSGCWREISFDRASRTVTLPAGLRIDLGGIGKGFTVDRAIAAAVGSCVLVNASGDLYAAGKGPDGQGWRVTIDDPFAPGRDLAELRVSDRGVATSSTQRRAWMRGDERLHHLVDARSGRPALSSLVQVTVVAATATAADVLAKCLLIAGESQAADLLALERADAVLVRDDGSFTMTAGMAAYLA